MIDEKIKKIINDLNWLAEETKANNIYFEDNEIKVRIRKYYQAPVMEVGEAVKEIEREDKEKREQELKPKKIIKSERVGFIYLISTKTKRYFVNEGDIVKEGDILAVITSMKIEYPIKSIYSGKIKRICVENGQPVEYDQVLFEIE